MNQTVVESISPHLHLHEEPYFRLLREIPEGLGPQIEHCVKEFVKDSKIGQGIDAIGFFNQTIESIAQMTYLNMGGDFWIGTVDGKVMAYVLARASKDIDNKMSYWISQAYADKSVRFTPFIKEAMAAIRQRAKDCLCRHIVVVAGRNSRAYKRMFGFHDYAVLLKEDI